MTKGDEKQTQAETAAQTGKRGKKAKKPAPKATLKSELRFYGIFFACALTFWTFGYGHYRIPSESMQPTLEVGDRLYVSKFSYGYSRQDLPFGDKFKFLGNGILFERMPERGDVAVFIDPTSRKVLIKRLVGLPGDKILYRQGRLFINGEIVERKDMGQLLYREHKVRGTESEPRVVQVSKYEESWPGEDGSHFIYEQSDGGYNDNRGPFTVPAGHTFFVGDNRDNSTDSRAPTGPGFVPIHLLIGRAERMVLSFKRCKKEEGIHCPGKRWFQKL